MDTQYVKTLNSTLALKQLSNMTSGPFPFLTGKPINTVLDPDLLQVPELLFLFLDFLLLLDDLCITVLLLHPQLLDYVAVLQLLLGQLFT